MTVCETELHDQNNFVSLLRSKNVQGKKNSVRGHDLISEWFYGNAREVFFIFSVVSIETLMGQFNFSFTAGAA